MARKKIKARSGFEKSVMEDLNKRGVKYDYEPCAIEYDVPARKGKYYPDIRVKGQKFFIEIKGKFTSKDRTKHLRIKEAYPELDVRFLFQRDNWLTKTHTARYSDWAKRNGFKYVVGAKVPSGWVV